MTADTNDLLLTAAGFTGAAGAASIDMAQRKAAIGKAQLGLEGEGKREDINTDHEDRGMYNSGHRETAIARQQGGEQSESALLDLGVGETVDKAHLSAMEEIARTQLAAEALVEQRRMFDENMALQRQQLAREAGPPIDTAGAAAAAGSSDYDRPPDPAPSLDLIGDAPLVDRWGNRRGW
jgi:hypothetical protein